MLNVSAVVRAGGVVQISHAAQMYNTTGSAQAWASWSASGANTISASDVYAAAGGQPAGAGVMLQAGRTDIVKGLNPGYTTFTHVYRTGGGGTATFLNRSLSVLPL